MKLDSFFLSPTVILYIYVDTTYIHSLSHIHSHTCRGLAIVGGKSALDSLAAPLAFPVAAIVGVGSVIPAVLVVVIIIVVIVTTNLLDLTFTLPSARS